MRRWMPCCIVAIAAVSSLACGGSGKPKGSATSYSTADLAGTWEGNALASGLGAPWWERGQVIVAADGSYAGTLTDNSGEPDPVKGTLTISSAGVVTMSASSSASGNMDADKTVMVMTSTWLKDDIGTTDLSVLVKMAAGSYGLADLAGVWELSKLATGTGVQRWERVHLTVEANGSFVGSTTDSDGGASSTDGSFAISLDGVVTLVDGSGPFLGALDAGKTILVGTDISSGATELGVAVKMAETYSLADLAGTWEANGLASGPGAPWWERGHVTIASDGSVAGSTIDSDGVKNTVAGTLAISPGGVVTMVGSSTFRGALDAGKTILVGTDTWDSGEKGTAEMKVFTRVQ